MSKVHPLFILILWLAAIGLVSGCHGGKSWRPGMPLDRGRVKIGVIHPNRIDERSNYDYVHYTGTLEMQRNLGLRDSQIIRKVNVFDGDPRMAAEAMRDCIREGANIIIAPSWGYREVCEQLAEEYPGVVFAHAMGSGSNGTNYAGYFGQIYQARYLSGIAAGMKTQTGKVGYVAAMGKDNSEVSGGINAFALGVERVNPDARVYVRLTYNWFDPMGEYLAAEYLIASGCDVIAQHSNTVSPQIAAQDAGVWGIGYNSDMGPDAPDAVITSVVFNWGYCYTELVRSVIDGSFSAQPYFGSLADGMVDITPLAEALAAPGTVWRIAEERERIVGGGYNVFDGILETNDGRQVGGEGTLPDSEILDGIDWYYRTVIETQP